MIDALHATMQDHYRMVQTDVLYLFIVLSDRHIVLVPELAQLHRTPGAAAVAAAEAAAAAVSTILNTTPSAITDLPATVMQSADNGFSIQPYTHCIMYP